MDGRGVDAKDESKVRAAAESKANASGTNRGTGVPETKGTPGAAPVFDWKRGAALAQMNAPFERKTGQAGFEQEKKDKEKKSDVGNGAAANRPMAANASRATQHYPKSRLNGRKIFVGGVAWCTTDASFAQLFEQFGEVVDCVIMRDRATRTSRGFGFVTYRDPKSVEAVLSKTLELDGRVLDCKPAVPKQDSGGASAPDSTGRTKKIFVGGLAPDTTEADFREVFGRFGRVVDAKIMTDGITGRPRGFGFITFDSAEAVEKVVARHRVELSGKMVECKAAVPKNSANTGGNERGGGRSDGRHGGRGSERGGERGDSSPGYRARRPRFNGAQQDALPPRGDFAPAFNNPVYQPPQSYFQYGPVPAGHVYPVPFGYGGDYGSPYPPVLGPAGFFTIYGSGAGGTYNRMYHPYN